MKNKKGFTLIELLIVIVIVALLGLIVRPAIKKLKANQAASVSEVVQQPAAPVYAPPAPKQYQATVHSVYQIGTSDVYFSVVVLGGCPAVIHHNGGAITFFPAGRFIPEPADLPPTPAAPPQAPVDAKVEAEVEP